MKEKCSRTDYWLCKNIVVKVVLKKLGEKYYRQKAVVTVTLLANGILCQNVMLPAVVCFNCMSIEQSFVML